MVNFVKKFPETADIVDKTKINTFFIKPNILYYVVFLHQIPVNVINCFYTT